MGSVFFIFFYFLSGLAKIVPFSGLQQTGEILLGELGEEKFVD